MTKSAMFVDGSNAYATAKVVGVQLDYNKLYRFADNLWGEGSLLRAYYYTALRSDVQDDPLRPLVDYLSYNKYRVITKAAKVFSDGPVPKIKGNMDLDMALDMIKLSTVVDKMILFTGDGDFIPVVNYIQEKGVHITVISTNKTNPPMCADELRRQADHFFDLKDVIRHVSR
jgi:uncharacterized LabA/DUF88 family protein